MSLSSNVVDPNTIYLDLDHEICANLDLVPDLDQSYSFSHGYIFNFEQKILKMVFQKQFY